MSSTKPEILSDDLLKRVLNNLGICDRPSADINGLSAIYHGWCRQISYDNILHRIYFESNNQELSPPCDADEFFEDWLAYGTGGLCFSAAPALYSLLNSLGFDAFYVIGLIGAGAHGAVMVECDGATYHVDTAFPHSRPLRLDENAKTDVIYPGWGWSVQYQKQCWYFRAKSMHNPGLPIECRISPAPVQLGDLRKARQLSLPNGPNNLFLNARIFQQDTLIQVSGQRLWITDEAGGIVEQTLDESERFELLVNTFGIKPEIVRKLPPDRPRPTTVSQSDASRVSR